VQRPAEAGPHRATDSSREVESQDGAKDDETCRLGLARTRLAGADSRTPRPSIPRCSRTTPPPAPARSRRSPHRQAQKDLLLPRNWRVPGRSTLCVANPNDHSRLEPESVTDGCRDGRRYAGWGVGVSLRVTWCASRSSWRIASRRGSRPCAVRS